MQKRHQVLFSTGYGATVAGNRIKLLGVCSVHTIKINLKGLVQLCDQPYHMPCFIVNSPY